MEGGLGSLKHGDKVAEPEENLGGSVEKGAGPGQNAGTQQLQRWDARGRSAKEKAQSPERRYKAGKACWAIAQETQTSLRRRKKRSSHTSQNG